MNQQGNDSRFNSKIEGAQGGLPRLLTALFDNRKLFGYFALGEVQNICTGLHMFLGLFVQVRVHYTFQHNLDRFLVVHVL